MTRHYFGTDGVRGLVGKDPMSADFALRLASAAAQLFEGGDPKAATMVHGRQYPQAHPQVTPLRHALDASGSRDQK